MQCGTFTPIGNVGVRFPYLLRLLHYSWNNRLQSHLWGLKKIHEVADLNTWKELWKGHAPHMYKIMKEIINLEVAVAAQQICLCNKRLQIQLIWVQVFFRLLISQLQPVFTNSGEDANSLELTSKLWAFKRSAIKVSIVHVYWVSHNLFFLILLQDCDRKRDETFSNCHSIIEETNKHAGTFSCIVTFEENELNSSRTYCMKQGDMLSANHMPIPKVWRRWHAGS